MGRVYRRTFPILGEEEWPAILPALRSRQTGIRAHTGLVVSADGAGYWRTVGVHASGEGTTGWLRTLHCHRICATQIPGPPGMVERPEELHPPMGRRAPRRRRRSLDGDSPTCGFSSCRRPLGSL